MLGFYFKSGFWFAGSYNSVYTTYSLNRCLVHWEKAVQISCIHCKFISYEFVRSSWLYLLRKSSCCKCSAKIFCTFELLSNVCAFTAWMGFYTVRFVFVGMFQDSLQISWQNQLNICSITIEAKRSAFAHLLFWQIDMTFCLSREYCLLIPRFLRF